MAKMSEDVDVRCFSCGKLMGNVTVRSDVETEFSKIVWMNKNRMKCRTCDNTPSVRPRRS